MQYLDSKGITKADFYKESGLKRGLLDADKLSSTISDVFLAKIIAYIPDLNLEWLITGIGPDTKENIVREPTTVYKLKTDRIENGNQHIPLYDIEAVAGLTPLFNDNNQSVPIDHIVIPHLPKCDGALKVTGDSMYPLLKSGDIVMYKQIHDITNNIFWGEMYLLAVDNGDEEYITIKYIQKSDKGDDWVKLVSQNKHHSEQDFERSRIKALALVKASIRINSMS